MPLNKKSMKIFCVRDCQKHINVINVWEWATFSSMKQSNPKRQAKHCQCQAKHCQ